MLTCVAPSEPGVPTKVVNCRLPSIRTITLFESAFRGRPCIHIDTKPLFSETRHGCHETPSHTLLMFRDSATRGTSTAISAGFVSPCGVRKRTWCHPLDSPG